MTASPEKYCTLRAQRKASRNFFAAAAMRRPEQARLYEKVVSRLFQDRL
jgi:hypothetical protein